MLRPSKRLPSPQTDEKLGKGKRNRDDGRSSSSSSDQQIVSTPILLVIVFIFIFMGFASEHYNRTRSIHAVGKNTIDFIHKKEDTVSLEKYANAAAGTSLLSPEEDESLEYVDSQRYHLIFSTDCSPYQHWQT
jgi:hypothetical protein